MALASDTSVSAAPWRVIVTRPGREAQAWADALLARGVSCDTLPLIEIAALPNPKDLVQGVAGRPSAHGADVCQCQCGAFFHGGPTNKPADAQRPRLVDWPRHPRRFAGGWLA